MPLVSIITINYNEPEATAALVRSCQNLNLRDFEIIVVDNASVKRPDRQFFEDYPEVKFVQSDVNLGFAGGNNLGINEAKGDFLCFLNNDLTVTPDLLNQLISVLEQYPEVGGVSPKILYAENPGQIQFAGYTRVNRWTGRNFTVGKHQADTGQFDTPKPTAYLHGAAMMIRREVIEKAGPMPEDFFLYYEEIDWCEQILRAGYGLMVQPQAVVYHHGSLSVGKDSVLKTYYYNRNRILFMRRNTNRVQFTVFTFYMLIISIPKTFLTYLLSGKTAHLKAFLKALLWHFPGVKNDISPVHITGNASL